MVWAGGGLSAGGGVEHQTARCHRYDSEVRCAELP